ncbi:MAG: beta-lactamase family protein, partial [Bacteroidales bacterium]|nr:beta-lactamase family protein [Bacteroidales bacterium]
KPQTGEFADGLSYGLGFRVITTPKDVTLMLSRGSFGHGGAFGTQSWADPDNNTLYIVMIQRRGFPGGDSHDIRHSLQEIASNAIMN